MEQQQQQQHKLDSDGDMLLDDGSIPVTQQAPSPAGSDDSANGQQNHGGGGSDEAGASAGGAGAGGTAAAAGGATAASAQPAGASTGRRRDNNFLEKLWNFLDDEVSRTTMGFSVNGQYLVIYNPDEVPRLLAAANVCKHKDYGSFQRQMCIYGWKRLAQNEMNKLVLTDGEAPGATVSQLGPSIKIMQHEVLERDSPMDEVRAVPRKAKPKASRAKDGGAAAAAKAGVPLDVYNAQYQTKQEVTTHVQHQPGVNSHSHQAMEGETMALLAGNAAPRSAHVPYAAASGSAQGSLATHLHGRMPMVPQKRPAEAIRADLEAIEAMRSRSGDAGMSQAEIEALIASVQGHDVIMQPAKQARVDAGPSHQHQHQHQNGATTTSHAQVGSGSQAPPAQPLAPANYRYRRPTPYGTAQLPMPGMDDDASSLAKLARFDMETLQRSMQEAFLMLDNSRPSANGEHLVMPDADFFIEPALAGLRFDATGVAIMQPVPAIQPVPARQPAQHQGGAHTAAASQGQEQIETRPQMSPAQPQAGKPQAIQAAAKPKPQNHASSPGILAARSASPITVGAAADAFTELTTLPTTDLLSNKLGLLPHADSGTAGLSLSPAPPRQAFASAFKQPSLWV